MGQHRKHQKTRNGRASLESVVAHQALLLLQLQYWMPVVLLAQFVEQRPGLRVDRSNLNVLPVIDPAHVDIVVEVNRARRVGRNLSELKAGLRKDQRLRRDWNLVVLQKGRKISPFWGVLELHLPGHAVGLPILPQGQCENWNQHEESGD